MFPCEYLRWAKQQEQKRWNVLAIVSRNDEMPGVSPTFFAEPLYLMKGSIALLCVPGAEVIAVLPTPIQNKAAVKN